jgi:hypothetical protein
MNDGKWYFDLYDEGDSASMQFTVDLDRSEVMRSSSEDLLRKLIATAMYVVDERLVR